MTGQDFGEALHAWRNVPRADGYSPAMLLFGRRQHTKLPTLPFQHMLVDRFTAHSTKALALKSTLAEFDKRATKRPTLSKGDRVIIQDPTTKLWATTGTIQYPTTDGQSYVIQTDTGQEIRRGIKLLRRLDQPQSPPAPASPKEDKQSAPTSPNEDKHQVDQPDSSASRRLQAAPSYLLQQNPTLSPAPKTSSQLPTNTRPVRKKFANVRFRDYI